MVNMTGTVTRAFQKSDGMSCAPKGKTAPVCQPGEFTFAAAALDHGHIYGQCNGLIEAGATLKWVYDPDPVKVEQFVAKFPEAKPARSLDEILDDDEIRLIAAAAVPCDRAALGFRVMMVGKDYFTDKGPFTSLEQLAEARATVAKTGRKYMVYYSERTHTESGMFAGDLIEQGAIGKVVQVIGLGPHRLGPPGGRPDWFYKKAKHGGILCDIGSHQCEQFLFYAGATDATVTNARVANFGHPEFPELEDFGEASLVGNNGASFYFRVDWFTPDGLRTWGDGRTMILGTDGFIEIRKYVDIGTERMGDQLYLVNQKGETHFDLAGRVGYPFFGQLILDCLNRTEKAMTQAHAFRAAELCLKAQQLADAGRFPRSH
jgi:predicted dehydrogenase